MSHDGCLVCGDVGWIDFGDHPDAEILGEIASWKRFKFKARHDIAVIRDHVRWAQNVVGYETPKNAVYAMLSNCHSSIGMADSQIQELEERLVGPPFKWPPGYE